MIRRAWSVVGWVALVVVIAAPVAGFVGVLVTMPHAPAEIAPTATPLLLEPTEHLTDGARNATLEVALVPGRPLLSPGGHGIVTYVFVEAGQRVSSGSRIFEVDGVARIAQSSPRPYYRPLSFGDVGADVVALKALLVEVGIPVDSDSDIFDASTRRAVQELWTQLGASRPSSVFTPDLVVWLPIEELVVGTVHLVVGEPVPPLGTPMVSAPEMLASADLRMLDGSLPSQDLAGGPVIDAAQGVVLGELTDSSGSILLTSAGAAMALNVPTAPSEAAVPRVVRIDVVVTRSESVTLLVVPASAVMTDATGRFTCVWLRGGDTWQARAVTVATSGQPGTVDVSAGSITRDDVLLANPVEILADATCPSS